jgi:hypothetical protein
MQSGIATRVAYNLWQQAQPLMTLMCMVFGPANLWTSMEALRSGSCSQDCPKHFPTLGPMQSLDFEPQRQRYKA